ncbi:MAG: hypothetical protein JJE09_11420 [Bacteroidia bacterium]|nr:hypothetical protein [Bacteroidia bacterium]
MKETSDRRSFLKKLGIGGVTATVAPTTFLDSSELEAAPEKVRPIKNLRRTATGRKYNAPYSGEYLKRVAFPIGGLGAGMFCLEGTGAISHMSVRNKPEIFHEPGMFAALNIRGLKNGTKVIEGPSPDWKKFGQPDSGNGSGGAVYGLPRFHHAEFITRFPFATINLADDDLPLSVTIEGWSPFIPTDADNSSLPVGALEYKFTNTGAEAVEGIFSFNSRNFMRKDEAKGSIQKIANGFVLSCEETAEKPHLRGDFAIFTNQPETVVDHCWFRGGWFDPLTIAWESIRSGNMKSVDPVESGAPGASLYVPFKLAAGEAKTIQLMMAWYVPSSDVRIGKDGDAEEKCDPALGCCNTTSDLGMDSEKPFDGKNYKPWYSNKFWDIYKVASYFQKNYSDLKSKSQLFGDAFYASTLPPEVIEAVAANLTILKSPTVMRQFDGRLWSYEGCGDNSGCCHGSCTHVWNYAQAIPHLFPSLERTLRHTEFCEDQNAEGHQTFRAAMPIRPVKHDFHAAADGQLGGIMKVYRDWRIVGDSEWLKKMYPLVKSSMDYCIRTWDPRNKGVLEEPHHNTYDIEFWGPDGMCTSFYLGALNAMMEMGKYLKKSKDVTFYKKLYDMGKKFMETELYDGEYFYQKIQTTGLNAKSPTDPAVKSYGGDYSDEAKLLLEKEGPKYQYGAGCLSDGVLGSWIARMCGLEEPLDIEKTKSHLIAVHKYNLKDNLSDHANPQRPSFAMGDEGGLLLCSWPKGGKLSLPFVYSDEVWTGIEYQVASHLMLMGKVEEGLEIVRTCRDRYDGRTRNPFNEYECGHWYARALSSYGFLQGLTGARIDAVNKTLYINSKVGDFTSFISTEKGFGTVSLNAGKASLKVMYGSIQVEKVLVDGKSTLLN